MTDISGYGLRVNIKASTTFPSGIEITQFADDADPLDNPATDVATATMGLNGDLVTASAAAPLIATLNVIPTSENDRDLAVLAQANVVGKGRTPAKDKITMTITYPGGRTATLTNGAMTNAILLPGVASAGRLKTRSYTFAFETMTVN